MMNQLLRNILQMYTLFGLSIPGYIWIVFRNRSSPYSKFTMLTSAIGVSLYWYFYRKERVRGDKKNVIIITGCDSGLGYTMALEALNELNFTVIAGVHNMKSDGAALLRKECLRDNLYQVELDITSDQSIFNAVQIVEMFFTEHPDYDLWALVNNAGVMVFGEFEWQTVDLIKKQVDVNLIGTMKFTNALMPFLRKYSSRIINVVSHCGLNALPGLSVYGATKAALCAWSDALQFELEKFNVKVIQFLPGSCISATNLMSNHKSHVLAMENSMSKEQFFFYKNYFEKYNAYLQPLSDRKEIRKIYDRCLLDEFAATVLDKRPKRRYINETFYYKFHRILFTYCPFAGINEYFLNKFMAMPQWD